MITDASVSDIAIVQVTPSALAQLNRILADKSKAGIRLSVVGGGCAGLQYKMDPVDMAEPGDLTQHFEDVIFYVHPMAAPYLKGVLIDYNAALLDGGFKFQNPNASSTCGCGTSFGI